jgi:hypothetical protein
MTNKIYLIEYKNKVIGTYLNYKLAKTYILSCLQNNLMENYAKILIYKNNSCYYLDYKIIKLEQNEVLSYEENYGNTYETYLDNNNYDNNNYDNNNYDNNNYDTSYDNNYESTNNTAENSKCNIENYYNIINKKSELQHKLNLIKYTKDRIEEAKNVYKVDLELFEKFNTMLELDSTFKIPELFYDKFIIFKKLKEQDNLNFDNFIKNYNNINNSYDYFPLNEYENTFI